MSHYAKVKNGIVVSTIVASSDFFEDFIDDTAGEWIKTSYNTRNGFHWDNVNNEDWTTLSEDQSKALRKNFASEGMVYDYDRDAFYAKQPFNSWTLDEETCNWQPPVAYPDDDSRYLWNEETTSWDAV
jgi:hypothetical protein